MNSSEAGIDNFSFRVFSRMDGINVEAHVVMDWRIGCSGFHYPEWRGVFYPQDIAQRKWFEYYSGQFHTLELNVTYYRFPRVEALKKWYNISPKNFLFTVKAPRHITHFKKFKDAQRMLSDFNQTVRDGLRDKLGCILFQFPANYSFEEERLARIISIIDPSVKNVLEFRDASWWKPEVFKALEENDVSFCGMSHPSLPDNVVATTPILYYRFHGVPHLYKSKYDLEKLERVAHSLRAQERGKESYVYFNNTADGHAPVNARQFQELAELVHKS